MSTYPKAFSQNACEILTWSFQPFNAKRSVQYCR